MKKYFKVLTGLLGFCAFGMATVFYLTSGMVDAADQFFMAAKDQNIERAYSFVSADFKDNTPEASFGAHFANLNMQQFKQAKWTSRKFSGTKGQLDGSIVTQSGSLVPISLGFVKVDDSWKIDTMGNLAPSLS
jgi:hypothetical protein